MRIDEIRTELNPRGHAGFRRPQWLTVLALSLVLVAAACGGDEGSSPESPNPPTNSTTGGVGSGDAPPESTPEGDKSPPEATVTIGSDTYNFSEEGLGAFNCNPNHQGAFRASLRLIDETGGLVSGSGFDVALLLDGVEPDRTTNPRLSDFIYVQTGNLDESNNGWQADGQDAEDRGWASGSSQVDTYVIDGISASGTATFVGSDSSLAFLRGEVDAVESVQGTFTVTCGS